MIRIMSLFILIVVGLSCGFKKKGDLVLTNDELVHVLVEMYTANAALEINDPSFKDSMSVEYFKKVAEVTGFSTDVIRKDFEKLILMPDSLLMIQGRAMDTLRHLVEKSISTPPISIGLE